MTTCSWIYLLSSIWLCVKIWQTVFKTLHLSFFYALQYSQLVTRNCSEALSTAWAGHAGLTLVGLATALPLKALFFCLLQLCALHGDGS